MQLETGSRCPFHIEDGVMMDFIGDQWLILIKDQVWQPEELRSFGRNAGKLSLLPLDTVVFFTLSIEDVLEPSDLPFLIQDCEGRESLLEGNARKVTLLLVGQEDLIMARRELTLPEKENRQLTGHLKRILEEGFTSEVSNHQIDKTQARYQPYELEEKALFSVSF